VWCWSRAGAKEPLLLLRCADQLQISHACAPECGALSFRIQNILWKIRPSEPPENCSPTCNSPCCEPPLGPVPARKHFIHIVFVQAARQAAAEDQQSTAATLPYPAPGSRAQQSAPAPADRAKVLRAQAERWACAIDGQCTAPGCSQLADQNQNMK
jgi:hypothetical protein